MSDETKTFLDRVDAFAAELSPNEQAMLQALLSDASDEVAGFGFEPPWPGVRVIAPVKIGGLATSFEPFLSSGYSTDISNGDLGSGRRGH